MALITSLVNAPFQLARIAILAHTHKELQHWPIYVVLKDQYGIGISTEVSGDNSPEKEKIDISGDPIMWLYLLLAKWSSTFLA